MAFRQSSISSTARRILNLRGGLLRQSSSYNDNCQHHESRKCNESPPQFFTTKRRPYGDLSFAAVSPAILGIGIFPYSSCTRYMSSSSSSGEGSSASVDILDKVVTERTVDIASQAPGLSEVAVAAADSAYPVAAFQHLIDTIHSFTGFNWWASIALTTLLIRGATLPLLINFSRVTYQFAPTIQLKEVDTLVKYILLLPWPFWGTLAMSTVAETSIFLSSIFAIRNMAEKVPSFQTGGALWFTDLTTQHGFYMLPFLTLVTMSIRQKSIVGFSNRRAADSQLYCNILIVAIPMIMGFPQAMYVHWITSNIFAINYEIVTRLPAIRKLLNFPQK